MRVNIREKTEEGRGYEQIGDKICWRRECITEEEDGGGLEE